MTQLTLFDHDPVAERIETLIHHLQRIEAVDAECESMRNACDKFGYEAGMHLMRIRKEITELETVLHQRLGRAYLAKRLSSTS